MIPYITKQQMQKIDDFMIEKYGIEIRQMMELAGFGTAEFCRRVLGSLKNKKIVIVCGTGHNGGDGIAASRFLHNWGAKVYLFVISEDIKIDSQHHLNICKKIGIKIIKMNELEDALKFADLVVDALLGYNVKGNPQGIIADSIRLVNKIGKPILSIDMPSGLDPNSGEALNPCIKANYTLALSLPKHGLESENSGEISVLDIGVPDELLKEIGINDEKIFSSDFIISVS